MPGSYSKLFEKNKVFAQEENSISTGLVRDTVSVFKGTNMSAVTSCENTLSSFQTVRLVLHGSVVTMLEKCGIERFKDGT